MKENLQKTRMTAEKLRKIMKGDKTGMSNEDASKVLDFFKEACTHHCKKISGKMKEGRDPIADLYVRVSTDEQADKGYSQRNQEEMLRKYCESYFITIRNVIYEDHSAKTFNRPEWKKLNDPQKEKEWR